MMTPLTPEQEEIECLRDDLCDQGKWIEGGWIAVRGFLVPPEASEAQRDAMRDAFFAGADAVIGALSNFLEDDAPDPEEADRQRRVLVDEELSAFRRDFLRRHRAKDDPP